MNIASWPSPKLSVAVMRGGLDLITPVQAVESGAALTLHNYELDTSGQYRRIKGYERFDGRSAPSEQNWQVVEVSNPTLLNPGDTVTGQSSGASATVAGIIGAPASHVVLVSVSGSFTAGETLTGPGVTLDRIWPLNTAQNTDLKLEAQQASADHFRALISEVPGSGPVRGLAEYNWEIYAVRDNAAGTQAVMHKATPTGWQAVTGAVFTPGPARYEFREHNFLGSAGSKVLIGVNGLDQAFLMDSGSFGWISTGMPDDRPTALEVLANNSLALGFDTGSLLLSSSGDPGEFLVANGAAEIAVGEAIRRLQVQPNQTLAVFCTKALKILYGLTAETFRLSTIDDNAGVRPESVTKLADSVFLNDRGLTRMTRVQEFGDFDTQTLSVKVKPLIDRIKDRIACAFAVQGKGQYRVCDQDGLIVAAHFSGTEPIGFSTMQLDQPVRCAVEATGLNGAERTFVGCDDGLVYELDKGYSFDGQPYRSVFRPAYDTMRSPSLRKRFTKVELELDTQDKAVIRVKPELDYHRPQSPLGRVSAEQSVQSHVDYYDDWHVNTDAPRYSAGFTGLLEIYLTAVGRSLSLLMLTESDREPPYTIKSITTHWTPKGRDR